MKTLITIAVLLWLSSGIAFGDEEGDPSARCGRRRRLESWHPRGRYAVCLWHGGRGCWRKISSSFEAEVNQSLANIDAVLKQAGMSAADVVSVQVYLTDGALFERMNAIYKQHFKEPRPTRTTVVVAKLVGEGHIEITATARK